MVDPGAPTAPPSCPATAADESQPSVAAEKTVKSVNLDPSLRDGDPIVLTAWLVYGTSKARLYGSAPPPTANDSADDYELELGAREFQSQYWEEQRRGGAAPADPNLDRQLEIWRAGFLPEFVLMAYGHPGWTVSAHRLASLRLDQFVARFPGSYEQRVAAGVRTASGKLVADIPGADFPEPGAFPMSRLTCSAAPGERDTARERWSALLPRLGGEPVAALSAPDLAKQLASKKREEQGIRRGVTWVSPKVSYFAALDGFCAVEAQDWQEAHDLMLRVVSLRPAEAIPRLELAQTLIALKRFDAALQVLEQVLIDSDDPCRLAIAWRARGYIGVETGALEEARDAYTRSLTFDPSSEHAKRELALIAELIARRGGSKRQSSYSPPLRSEMRLSVCAPPRSTDQ